MKQRKPGCYIAAVLLAGLMLGGCGNPNAKANTAESVSASDSETVSESEEIVSAETETENGFETETETETEIETETEKYSLVFRNMSGTTQLEIGGILYDIREPENIPFEETYDMAVERHGVRTPWD